MGDVHMGTPRSDFDEAVAYYVQVLSEVTADQWQLPARGTQTVLQVAAQGSRPLTTTRDFLAAGADDEEIHNTVGYFVRSKPVDAETAAGIQRRGVEALERLQGGDPASIVADLAEQVLAPCTMLLMTRWSAPSSGGCACWPTFRHGRSS